ncbi:MAG: pyruvate kinase [Clostridium sp.]|uniref:pyruvate kinase n=1 Tax=Clostridium sp. TaxID=1506 RepID=UPI003F3C01DD
MRIIATIGPSVKEKKVIDDLILAGVNTFRFNFSHGTITEFEDIRDIIKKLNCDVHIMVDLPGSKIRISDKLPYIYKIYNEEEVIFCGEDVYINEGYTVKKGKVRVIPLNIKNNTLREKEVKSISMKDGTMNFEIIGREKRGIRVKVKRGGIVRAGKGCNIKGYNRESKELYSKDTIALNWAIKNKADIICQSFVEGSEDILKVKKYIKENSSESYKPKIYGKIETPNGIEKAKIIADEVDGVVIGRGDLVPESSIIEAPIYQKKLLEALKDYNGEIIAGTHILNSMKGGRSPEFAEVDSVYNLIKNGINGFLLSGETSIGKAPIKTVEFLKDLIIRYE